MAKRPTRGGPPAVRNIPYGTLHDPKRQHAVLDVAHWKDKFPLGRNRGEGGWVDGPGDVARLEQARRLAKSKGRLGRCVPADLFVWSMNRNSEKPWLTQLGGRPWREKNEPWPVDPDGVPLHFLGQICFADSRDILPCKLPGDVALIFGRWQDGWAFTDEVGVLEWSPLKLKEPLYWSPGWTTELPFCFEGVNHRTVQYTDQTAAETPFQKAGWKHGGFGVRSVQATSIGAYAHLPQGWPLDDDETLIATLSSFYFRGRWPLCNVPRTHQLVRSDGSRYEPISTSGLDFGVGDAGCIWIYRDKRGNFKLGEACG